MSMQVVPGVSWVGAKDPDLRIFDIVMETKYGTTYNAYLIQGQEKTALVETVKSRFYDELKQRIEEIVPLSEIDYVVVNHTEPDHSGSLGRLLLEMPKATVVASKVALRFLGQQINRDFNQQVAVDGDKLDLGGKTLRFINAPFLHWPDSMFTYLLEDKILFSCDAFGCHYCGDSVFNDEVGDISESYKYYFDVIVKPFRRYVLEAAEKIKDLDIQIIAPSHGPILRKDPWSYVQMYAQWSQQTKDSAAAKSVLILYTSAYGYTTQLAEAIGKGLSDAGLQVEILEFTNYPQNEIIDKIENADAFLIGSPTINRDAVPPVWQLLSGVSAIINNGKPAGAFGSYGWSGEAVKLVERRLQDLQLKVPVPGVRVNFAPSEADLQQAKEFGYSFGEAVKGNS
ncbi:beta-lactamase domain protein [Desulfofarcimen acetoxidans DSM 771]|jgi:flavorubredoxin|uniref:Beta-lactamase domain protein n=1 Tax=Desulfofarcimen acetoxidans (strain ATCC 49208 / DSM 771 / KCTC 5769 / VKM B-1644 / 5575) TaxID=485916 RepID=C8VZX9_DESAS|nr:FprA family A-type flavoprotein [Desulfofarcimen acetoxidans]ACV63107.1 beta-lactamase domain protein [Desulfofarcimen acetoxidans DSM 771]